MEETITAIGEIGRIGTSSDNNTTGSWELTLPLGSFADLNGDGNPDVGVAAGSGCTELSAYRVW